MINVKSIELWLVFAVLGFGIQPSAQVINNYLQKGNNVTMDSIQVPVKVSEYLLTQSVLGITTLLGLTGMIILYNELKKARASFDLSLQKKDETHAIEIAAERKRNAELQEQRVKELIVAMDTVNKSSEITELALRSSRGTNGS